MHERLLITGDPGMGRSTAIARLQDKYPDKLTGIISSELVAE